MEIKQIAEQKTLVIRVTTPVGELKEVMGSAYGELAAFAGANGVEFAGPPFALYHNMDMNALDVEIGFPVISNGKTGGRVQNSVIQGGEVAATVFKGSYENLEQAYGKLTDFVKEKGRKVKTWMYESYLNDPQQVSPDELLTEILFPLEK